MGETYTENNKQKADILTEQFNLIVKADLANINKIEITGAKITNLLNISYKVIKKEL